MSDKYNITSFQKLYEDLSLYDDLHNRHVTLCLDYLMDEDNMMNFSYKTIKEKFDKYISEYKYLDNPVIIEFCSKLKHIHIIYYEIHPQHVVVINSEIMIMRGFLELCTNIKCVRIANFSSIMSLEILSPTCKKIIIHKYDVDYNTCVFEHIEIVECYRKNMTKKNMRNLKSIFPNAEIYFTLKEDEVSLDSESDIDMEAVD